METTFNKKHCNKNFYLPCSPPPPRGFFNESDYSFLRKLCYKCQDLINLLIMSILLMLSKCPMEGICCTLTKISVAMRKLFITLPQRIKGHGIGVSSHPSFEMTESHRKIQTCFSLAFAALHRELKDSWFSCRAQGYVWHSVS